MRVEVKGAGVGREILNNRFTTERGLCDLGYKTNSRISEILVTKWAQASIVLWTVSATWNTNSQIAAAKPKA